MSSQKEEGTKKVEANLEIYRYLVEEKGEKTSEVRKEGKYIAGMKFEIENLEFELQKRINI